jgi:hypothetical protein
MQSKARTWPILIYVLALSIEALLETRCFAENCDVISRVAGISIQKVYWAEIGWTNQGTLVVYSRNLFSGLRSILPQRLHKCRDERMLFKSHVGDSVRSQVHTMK